MNANECFPENFIYLCDKLPEYIAKDNNLDLCKAKSKAELLLASLEKYLLTLRSDDQGATRSETKRAIFALTRLIQYCISPNTSRMQIDDANIFAHYIMLTAKCIYKESVGKA